MIALVYVNRGRWVVDCPGEECGWAYLAVSPTGHARYQHRCAGSDNDGCGTMLELVWPTVAEAEQIAEALAARASKANRNWTPTETVDDLLAENTAALVGRDITWLAEQGIGITT